MDDGSSDTEERFVDPPWDGSYKDWPKVGKIEGHTCSRLLNGASHRSSLLFMDLKIPTTRVGEIL